jgi:hypothetical protein
MKNQIPEFLKSKLTIKTAAPKFFPDDMKTFIMEYGKYYNYPNKKNLEGNQLLSLWFRYMKSGIAEVGVCGYNGCTHENRIVNNSDTNGFLISVGCCVDHSVKLSMTRMHGVENAMHLQSSKDKIKATNLERFGVENLMKLESIKNKISTTMLEKYGIDNIFKNNDFIKSKFKEKYGVENPSQVPEFQKKKETTTMKNYGVRNPAKSPIIQQKIQTTCLEKYGTTFPMMLSGYNIKEYKWKTGEISYVQGYEPLVLKDLEEQGYKYEDVITGFDKVPTISYFFENKQRTYYPDIYIPDENRIIEVKSEWTLSENYDQNQAKFSATIANGYELDVIVK